MDGSLTQVRTAVVDHVGLPVVNPWKRAVRASDIQFRKDGTGVLVTEARAASAGLSTNYTLWDLGTNAALDAGLAAGLMLSRSCEGMP